MKLSLSGQIEGNKLSTDRCPWWRPLKSPRIRLWAAKVGRRCKRRRRWFRVRKRLRWCRPASTRTRVRSWRDFCRSLRCGRKAEVLPAAVWWTHRTPESTSDCSLAHPAGDWAAATTGRRQKHTEPPKKQPPQRCAQGHSTNGTNCIRVSIETQPGKDRPQKIFTWNKPEMF